MKGPRCESAASREAESQRIRGILLATRGARLCPLCPVITRGGLAGEQQHLVAIHPEERWSPR